MDWVILALLVIALMYCITLMYRLDRIDEKLRVMNQKFSTRQANVTSRTAHGSIPHVDAKGRTTKRDSTDLPATGRMSDGIHRRKRDASIHPDN